MASVSSSDGGYNQYMRSVGELEEEYNLALKKQKENSEKQIDSIYEKSQENTQEVKDDYEHALKQTKEDAAENIAYERANNKSEIERLKADTYDRFGRFGGNSADIANQQNKELKKVIEETKKENDRRMSEIDQNYQAKLASRSEKQAEELENAVDVTKDSAESSFRSARMAERAGDSDFRAKKEKEYAALESRLQEERTDQRALTNHALDELTTGYEHRLNKLGRKEDIRNERRENIHNDELVELSRRLSEEHHRALSDLKRTVSLDDEEKRSNLKARIQSIADNIKDNETEWLVRKERLQAANDAQVAKLKNDLNDVEFQEAEKSSLALREKEKHFGEIIRNQSRENRLNEKTLAQNFDAGRKQTELAVRKDQALQARANEAKMAKAYESQDAALRKQSESFNQAFENQKAHYTDEIKHLQNSLQDSRTTTDIADISPAAEEIVRRSVVKEYEKTRLADEERNKKSHDHLKQEYSGRVIDVAREKDTKTTRLIQTASADRQHDKQELLGHIEEVEHSKRQIVQDQERSHQEQIDELSRKYSDIMNNQRRSYEEMIENLKNETNHRSQLERQDITFKHKIAMREANTRQSEALRDAERKRNEERFQFEAQLTEIKSGQDQLLRDLERSHKHDIEQMTKGYEQKIAQLESQTKEKERYLSQNFQDELDKVRRANALLIQKKS